MDVDKLLAGQARSCEHFYIIDGVHRSELVVRAVNKPGEMLARPCGQAVEVDEDVMSHAQLGDGNLMIIPGTIAGVLEVKADHFVLVILRKQLLHGVVGLLHHDWVIGVHHQEVLLPHVGVHGIRAELHWSAARYPLCMCHHECACCVVGCDRKVEETKVILAM
jgi:hypothetical protein